MKLSLLFIFIFSVEILSAKTHAESINGYDAILTKHVKNNGPGVAVIVSRGDQVLYQGARGMANVELDVPLSVVSVFRLGSITKQFTAAGILLLQEQGKLSVKDDIHKYVSDFPTEENKVTIENLLTHTSGIANYTEDESLFASEIQAPTNIDKMLERFAKHPMKFKTGEQFRYSNTGYVLLGKIIEVASGQNYAEFIDEHIFKKLKMNSSYFDSPKIIPNRANGYDMGPDGIVNAMYIDMMWPHAAGSLMSTVGDLHLWFNGLATQKLLAESSYQQMLQPFTLNDGSMSSYGYGIESRDLNKYKTYAHGGGIPGFVTNAFYVPEEKLYVAVLSNLSNRNVGILSTLLGAQALDIEVPTFTAVTLNENKVKQFLGTYKTDSGSSRTLSLENGKLYSQRDNRDPEEIFPMADNQFYFEGSLTYLVAERNSEGKKVINAYHQLSSEPEVAILIEKIAIH
ncbi:serine hydrolase domain-containing protein [Colwellia hornerae]|uniref:Beta-lactamase family protein n=1 Tax=Colwellia hornerae TaxID=89402 RepID=A0A5C6QMX1_9GAMM|nr:serine hydrolase domain-containing protein [Colwellia hornerae]TWX53652.1 beta-lactamase family protein [Colwellia hornerae]TWX60303.1 beta-lactamase family protein [Colwellia hornerae]TWX70058.1 beta-lactamase family protein [Colwellia hornerae]